MLVNTDQSDIAVTVTVTNSLSVFYTVSYVTSKTPGL